MKPALVFLPGSASEHSRRTAAVRVALVCVLLCTAALPAWAGLIWEIRLENPPAVVGPMDTVVIRGVLFNSPASDQNLGVISSGFLGNPPGFDYEIGALASLGLCSGFQWGPDGSLQNQFQGVNLAPGQSFNFVYGRCVPPGGGYDPAIFQFTGELQLFRSSPERPMVGRSSDLIRWMVSDSAPLTVGMDIKPGSFPNSINPRSRGVIPVAILTTATFDATTVDPTGIRFGATGTEAAPLRSALEDVDGDGTADLILHFNTQDTGIQCGHTAAFLTGETIGGQMIQGSDSISTVGCK